MNTEKISLNERLFNNVDTNQKENTIMPKLSLSESLQHAKNGEIFDNTDTFPFIQELRRSANLPLHRMVTCKKIDEIKDKVHADQIKDININPINTYAELALMASGSCREEMSRKLVVNPIYDMADDEYDVMLLLWEIMLSEYSRRINSSQTRFPDCLNITSLFPAFQIPLPLYFKVAAQCCKDEERKNYLLKLYKNVYAPFLDKDPIVVKDALDCMKIQPSPDTGYCDPVTMLVVISRTHDRKIINTDEFVNLSYDIVITPFLLDESSSI